VLAFAQMFSLIAHFNSDLVGGPALGEGSTVNRSWAREQIWMKVPLLCLVLLQVVVLQSEPLMWQTVSTPVGVWAGLQSRPHWDHRAT
jgi:hypothetical protein